MSQWYRCHARSMDGEENLPNSDALLFEQWLGYTKRLLLVFVLQTLMIK